MTNLTCKTCRYWGVLNECHLGPPTVLAVLKAHHRDEIEYHRPRVYSGDKACGEHQPIKAEEPYIKAIDAEGQTLNVIAKDLVTGKEQDRKEEKAKIASHLFDHETPEYRAQCLSFVYGQMMDD